MWFQDSSIVLTGTGLDCRRDLKMVDVTVQGESTYYNLEHLPAQGLTL